MIEGAKKAPSALVDPAGFELLLEGLASGVVANIAQVRAGKLKPDEAADRDDAAVRSLARMLMDEHDSVRLGLPLLGAPLAEALRKLLARDARVLHRVVQRRGGQRRLLSRQRRRDAGGLHRVQRRRGAVSLPARAVKGPRRKAYRLAQQLQAATSLPLKNYPPILPHPLPACKELTCPPCVSALRKFNPI